MPVSVQTLLNQHVDRLLKCRLCPKMNPPVVSGGPVVSKVILVGQAPGDKEPIMGKPFAWTAGKTMFKWFEQSCGITEDQFRSLIYMAAVCRCFPGKRPMGGDRVPEPDEIENCSRWLTREIEILQPDLIIPVGKLAIGRFIPLQNLDRLIGQQFRAEMAGHSFDLVPLPHPSGASPWHRVEPGKSLLQKGLRKIASHPAMQKIRKQAGVA